ncbi:MAG: formate dehydrogenase accessory sulfurtransferase FdhD [Desulfitobacterium hafniense]|nr:formate dehydrogenase accessory sulfurtransferase FdhD [Desulfitobacterium hafniense]
MAEQSVEIKVLRFKDSQSSELEDLVVQEVPITIYYNEEEIVTLLCSPSQLKELVVGFLASEGFISASEDIDSYYFEPELNCAWVTGRERPGFSKILSKRFMSACCGKSRSSFAFANDAILAKHQDSKLTLAAGDIYNYAHKLQIQLPLFQATGGVHSGFIACNQEIVFTSYDIGRHNVFDKLLGTAVLAKQDISDHIICFSGRVSSEILLKVAKMNVPILIARSAPTDLAVKQAQELGITLIGFARDNRFNIYSESWRVLK